MTNFTDSEDKRKERATRVRNRNIRNILLVGATLIVVSVVMTWGMIALMSAPPPEMHLPASPG